MRVLVVQRSVVGSMSTRLTEDDRDTLNVTWTGSRVMSAAA